MALSLYEEYENAPLVRYETRYDITGIDAESREYIPYKVRVEDFTATNVDPSTLRHNLEIGGLQTRFDTAGHDLAGLEAQRQAQVKTIGFNLENLAQLDSAGVAHLVDNNINLILIAVIMYFLFKG